jgi:hypothetical protein
MSHAEIIADLIIRELQRKDLGQDKPVILIEDLKTGI